MFIVHHLLLSLFNIVLKLLYSVTAFAIGEINYGASCV